LVACQSVPPVNFRLLSPGCTDEEKGYKAGFVAVSKAKATASSEYESLKKRGRVRKIEKGEKKEEGVRLCT
jgi:hypothetical protein